MYMYVELIFMTTFMASNCVTAMKMFNMWTHAPSHPCTHTAFLRLKYYSDIYYSKILSSLRMQWIHFRDGNWDLHHGQQSLRLHHTTMVMFIFKYSLCNTDCTYNIGSVDDNYIYIFYIFFIHAFIMVKTYGAHEIYIDKFYPHFGISRSIKFRSE